MSAVVALLRAAPDGQLIWGGDWNHELEGRLYAGSVGGRRCIAKAVRALGLQVPTTQLEHREGGTSIDHIAVPASWPVANPNRIVCEKRVSDHDMYWVDVDASRY